MNFVRFIPLIVLAALLGACASAPPSTGSDPKPVAAKEVPFTGEIPFDTVVDFPAGDFEASLVKDGILLGGEAPTYGNYLITPEPIDAKQFRLEFTYTVAPGDSNEFEYWAAFGFMDNPVFMTGDPNDTAGKGISILCFQYRNDGVSDTYLQFMKTPGLEVLGSFKIAGPIKGKKSVLNLSKSAKGWQIEAGAKRFVIGFDKIPDDIFPDDKMYFFTGTHTTKGVPVKITLNKMNDVSFRN